MKTDEVVAEFRKVKQDYAYDPSIFNEEDERVRELKRIINTKLSIADKTLVILYAESQSFRKMGERLGVSHMTCRREIQRIRRIILQEYEQSKRGVERSQGTRREI